MKCYIYDPEEKNYIITPTKIKLDAIVIKTIELTKDAVFPGLNVDKALSDINSCDTHLFNCECTTIEDWPGTDGIEDVE